MEEYEWASGGEKSRFSGVIFMSVDTRGQSIDKMTINKVCALCASISLPRTLTLVHLAASIIFRFSRFKLKLLQAM